RYLPNGQLDPTFGANGIASTDWGLSPARICGEGVDNCRYEKFSTTTAIAADSRNRPVVAVFAYTGLSETLYGGSSGFGAVGRLTDAGAPDPSFGSAGLVRLDDGTEAPLLAKEVPSGPLIAEVAEASRGSLPSRPWSVAALDEGGQ